MEADRTKSAHVEHAPSNRRRPAKVLFYRDFHRLYGGDVKVHDYFEHVKAAPGFAPAIHFSPNSAWDGTNPWNGETEALEPVWRPESADILFLAGRDWQMLSPEQRSVPPAPVINLIQHVRHADPEQPLFEFLEHPAVRLCVSRQVAEAILETGRVNGPVHVIRNGIDPQALPPARAWTDRDSDVVVCGRKRPRLAAAVADALASHTQCKVLTDLLPRSEYLQHVAEAKVAVTLPDPTEGFYLPALEAMALGCTVVTLDCVGNRDFCRDSVTCFMPPAEVPAIADAARQALDLSAERRKTLHCNARDVVSRHSLQGERRRFHEILSTVSRSRAAC